MSSHEQRDSRLEPLALEITDAYFLFRFLYVAGVPPMCSDSADADDDGSILVADAVVTLRRLFLDGPALRSPGSDQAWFDPSPDSLTCAE